jgi:hypothetical protein
MIRLLTLLLVLAATPALAAPCPGNRQALGTSRVLVVNPQEYGRVGKMQYAQYPQLPLNDREVVLKTLAAECVKATFFSVGRQARQFPQTLRHVLKEGHSIGTHSQNHPLTFDQMPFESAQREIDDGIASVTWALGNPHAVAPFFRIPGLLRLTDVEDYLASKGIAVWSIDADADDWYQNATPESVVQKAMTRLNQRGKGILLLHDVQPVTALALPTLLQQLKANGYRVVHVVAPSPARVATRQPDTSPRRRSRTTRESEWHSTPPEARGWPYFRR